MIHFFYIFLLSFSSIFATLQFSREVIINNTLEDSRIDAYLKDLEELGYCVIPEVFSSGETKILYERIWHEFIEKAWPLCKMDDRSNWKEVFPIHGRAGIFAGPAGQIQVMWDLRQDPRIIDVFAKIWNTPDLIVSMDGLSLMCPSEIREGNIEPWPHVDQAVLRRGDGVSHDNNPPADFFSESLLKTKPYTVQGQFLFEDSFEGDGGFYCIPKSHLRFNEFAPNLEAINAMEIGREEKRKMRQKFLAHFFSNSPESYSIKHVTASRGSLILWDSRTIHWNQHPSKDRSTGDISKVRMVGYLCYVPKSRLTEESKILRKEAFDKGVSTGHDPVNGQPRYTKDRIPLEFIHYLEDVSYVQPEIKLTEQGKALLGIDE